MSESTKANVIRYYADVINEIARKNYDSNIAIRDMERIIDHVNRIYDLAKQLEVNEND